MVRVLLEVFLWATLVGFVTFCVLYSILASPWKDHMGRHVLTFMGGFAVAFIYAAASEFMHSDLELTGWLIILIMTTALVWWRVSILIMYQIKARRTVNKYGDSGED